MSTDLRTRIAAVLERHKTDPYSDWECECGSTGTKWNEHVAETVIRELALTPEHSYGTTYPNIPVEDRRLVRYVTEWTADE